MNCVSIKVDSALGVLIFLGWGFLNLSSCTKLSLQGARRASSFAIFGLRVGFVRIANVLDLVRRLATNYPLLVF